MSPNAQRGSPFVTDAVVLRLAAFGEADRMATLYTRSHGKVSAVARSARRSRRRFGAALAPFVLGEATLWEAAGREVLVLERLDVRRDFTCLGGDLVRFAHASYATELVRELTMPHKADAVLLDLLVEAYEVIATVAPSADVLRAFELRLLAELGVKPDLSRCLGCGEAGEGPLASPGVVASPGDGGLLCPRCAPKARAGEARPLPPDARRRLVEIQMLPTLDAAAALAPLPSPRAAIAREVVHALLRSHLAGPLRSLTFLRQLRGGSSPSSGD